MSDISDISDMRDVFSTTNSPASELAEKRENRWQFQLGGPFRCRRAAEKEALILGMICMLDMYTTLFWVIQGDAIEANPLLSWTFNYESHGSIAFILLKSASCVPALLLVPRLAQRHPRFTVWLLRAVIVFYICYYLKNVK